MLDKEAVGKRIAFFRKEKGITQKELADFLHISYQAVSKWEQGKSLPTVEMLHEISLLLNVTVDVLLDEDEWKNRRIFYEDSGLDTQRLYPLKKDIAKLVSKDACILSADYADACLFRMDTAQMEKPVYSNIVCVPGSKEKLAKEYRYNREICADVAGSAMNFLLQYGMKPVILKAMVLCGNYDSEQLYRMAQTFREVCDKNGVSFAGMEIAAQPVNFTSQEYAVSATVIGVQEQEKVLTGSHIEAGDVLIGMQTDGIEGTSYPFVKVMLDKNPGLYHAQIDEERFFLDELMRPNAAFTREIMALQDKGYLRRAFRINNSLLRRGCWKCVPEGLGVCIDLSAVPVLPLYRFLFAQDMIGENVFARHFHMGIGMVAIVPEKYREEAMEIIGQFSACRCIGRVVSDEGHKGEKIWSTGRIAWES